MSRVFDQCIEQLCIKVGVGALCLARVRVNHAQGTSILQQRNGQQCTNPGIHDALLLLQPGAVALIAEIYRSSCGNGPFDGAATPGKCMASQLLGLHREACPHPPFALAITTQQESTLRIGGFHDALQEVADEPLPWPPWRNRWFQIIEELRRRSASLRLAPSVVESIPSSRR